MKKRFHPLNFNGFHSNLLVRNDLRHSRPFHLGNPGWMVSLVRTTLSARSKTSAVQSARISPAVCSQTGGPETRQIRIATIAHNPVDSTPSYTNYVNFIGHLTGLSPELTGGENLAYCLKLSSLKKRAMEITQALSMLKARDLVSKPVRYLSAGEKQF